VSSALVWVDPRDGSHWAIAIDPADPASVEYWQSRDGGASWRGPLRVAQIASAGRDTLIPYPSRPAPAGPA